MPAEGFFPESLLTVVQKPTSLVPQCGICQLHTKCRSPKMETTGSGRKSVMIVGEAPGKNEDLEGRQFVGEAGQFLQAACRKVGFNLHKDAILTNSLACFTGDVRVDSPSPIEIGYRRVYSGPLLRLATVGGRVLTGTPNHPILTSRGWVVLGLLEEGDDLLCCDSGHGVGVGDAQVQDPPPQFKELLQSLAEMGNSERVIGGRMDFHGDGVDGNVDVVTQDGSLRKRAESSFCEHRGDLPFVAADELHGDRFGKGGSLDDTSVLFGGTLSSSGCSIGGSGQLLPAFGSGALQANSHGIALVSDGDTHAREQHLELLPSKAEGIRQRLQALSRVVTADRVVSVNAVVGDQLISGENGADRSCHVYNLQTRDGYYLANGIIVSNCRPPRNEIADDRWIDYCRPKVLNAIKEHDPTVVVLLGAYAVESVIGGYWKPDTGGIKRWAGLQIPCRKPNLWLCPTYHPSYIMREKGRAAGLFNMVFERHLKAAFDLAGSRPWDTVPDYQSQVELIYQTDRAAKIIRKMIEKGGTVAFDYECLVPKTKVMTDDFKWVEIGSLKVGDSLTCFEETPTSKSHWRKLVRGKVIATKRFKAPCVRITFTDGRVVEASKNHPWLVGETAGTSAWKRSDRLKVGSKIRQVTTGTWESDDTREGGWLAGFFDGEGYVTNKVTVAFAQVFGPLYDKAMASLKSCGFEFTAAEKICNNYPTRQRQMMGYCKGLQETLRFVGTIRPSRLVRNLQNSIFGKAALPRRNPFAIVAKVEYIGEKEVVGVTTDAGTYVAEGLCSHNTDRLKPDHPASRIICASICWQGKTTIAFPWQGEAIKAFRELMRSSVKKVSHNLKFEDRWTMRLLKTRIRNWKWDTLALGHVIDCRKNFGGLDFQAFARLGQEDYDSRLGHLMQARDDRGKKTSQASGNAPNDVPKIDLKSLLLYNGLDSLLTYLIYRQQERELGL